MNPKEKRVDLVIELEEVRASRISLSAEAARVQVLIQKSQYHVERSKLKDQFYTIRGQVRVASERETKIQSILSQLNHEITTGNIIEQQQLAGSGNGPKRRLQQFNKIRSLEAKVQRLEANKRTLERMLGRSMACVSAYRTLSQTRPN